MKPDQEEYTRFLDEVEEELSMPKPLTVFEAIRLMESAEDFANWMMDEGWNFHEQSEKRANEINRPFIEVYVEKMTELLNSPYTKEDESNPLRAGEGAE